MESGKFQINNLEAIWFNINEVMSNMKTDDVSLKQLANYVQEKL